MSMKLEKKPMDQEEFYTAGLSADIMLSSTILPLHMVEMKMDPLKFTAWYTHRVTSDWTGPTVCIELIITTDGSSPPTRSA